MNTADQLYKEMCTKILTEGYSDENETVRPKWQDGTPAHTKKIFCVTNRYDLSKEFPIMSLRRTYWKSAIDEILWIWQKKSNDVRDLKSNVWDEWAGDDNTIGKAYGYQLGKPIIHHIIKDGMINGMIDSLVKEYPSQHFVPDGNDIYVYMDQVDSVLYDLKYNKASRRILTNMFNHEELHEMNLAPCAYSMTFNVTGNKLNAILNQRSQDVLTANNWNMVQYAALVLMIAQVSNLEPGELVHVIADCHIYDRHIPLVEEMLQKDSYDAPIFRLDKKIKNFYDFTPDSFSIEGYKYNDFNHEIEVAI